MNIPRRYLVMALVFVAVFGVAFASFQIAFADAIVPACDSASSAGFAGACQLCDLVKLLRQLINFAVMFSVIVATLMFTYAGVLYVSAGGGGGEGQIKKAHGIFVKVFVGLVIILAAWLVIDIIMRSLMGEKLNAGNFGPWNTFQCEAYPTGGALDTLHIPNAPSNGTTVGAGTGVPFDQGAETDVRTALAGKVCVSASGIDPGANCQNTAPSCGGENYEQYRSEHGTGCTNVGGLTSQVQSALLDIKQHCNCNVTITGGSEAGHSGGSAHNDGRAVDLASDVTLARYLHDNASTLGISQICTPPGEYAQFRVGTTCSEAEDHIHVGF